MGAVLVTVLLRDGQAELQLMSVCVLSPPWSHTPHAAQLPLAMCVARQQEGLHQFLSASSNTRRRGTGRHVECEWGRGRGRGEGEREGEGEEERGRGKRKEGIGGTGVTSG